MWYGHKPSPDKRSLQTPSGIATGGSYDLPGLKNQATPKKNSVSE